MSTFFEIFTGLYAVSILFFIFYGWYCLLSVRKFIIKRYEKETDLLNTVYFQNHATFTRGLIGSKSAAIYAGHLLSCIYGWRFYSKNMMFRDIKSPEDVTKHFSKDEIYRVKRFGIVALIVASYAVCYLIFRIIWPEAFGR